MRALLTAMVALQREIDAAEAIQWSASPLAGVSASDVPGVALDHRRLEVRRALHAAEVKLKHARVQADLAAFELERAMGGWMGVDPDDKRRA